jgi:hypothetical protein
MDQEILMIGRGGDKKYFDGYSFVTCQTQRVLNYLSNDNIALELKNKEVA